MGEGARPRGTDAAQVIQVVKTEALIGRGIDSTDPCRLVIQYWSLDGALLASNDSWSPELTEEAEGK